MFDRGTFGRAQVLRRLEQELLAFKLETETKLTEEARRLSGLVVEQKRIGGRGTVKAAALAMP